jgi:hypothetical protein
MKKITLLIVIFVLLLANVMAQSPQAFKYQVLARDNSGNPLTNHNVSFRISIRDITPGGTLLYGETHAVTTNAFGLATLEIGNGTPVSSSLLFTNITWGSQSKFLQVEMDPNGGSSYVDMGTTQLLSVPYALYAENLSMEKVSINDLSDGISDNTDIFLGKFCGQYNGSSENHNTGVGILSLAQNDDGVRNTAVGNGTLNMNNSGSDNTAIGSGTMVGNTTGNYNSALGTFALNWNSTGEQNNAIGYFSLFHNENGYANCALGNYTLRNNTSGHSNVAIGNKALYSNTTASNLVAIGDSALYFNNSLSPGTDGHFNTAVGSKSLYQNHTGYCNTALGFESLRDNVSGYQNTALGFYALKSNSANANVGVGTFTLSANHADNNTALGTSALFQNTYASDNIAIGFIALYNQNYSNGNTSYYTGNIGIGSSALYYNNPSASSNGINNNAIGYYAMFYNTTGYENVTVGNGSLYNNTTGYRNTALGHAALNDLSPGNYNTALGFNAGPTNATPIVSNTTAVGNGAVVSASNQVRVGNSSVTSIGGIVGWSDLKQGKYMVGIEENIPGLEFITKLKPITFTYDIKTMNNDLEIENPDDWTGKYDIENIIFSGFVPEEVAKAANDSGFISWNSFTGSEGKQPQGLRYADLIAPLVKAMQEQQSMIEKLQQEVEALKANK